MKLKLYDTIGNLTELYTADISPRERLAIARDTILHDDHGLQQAIGRGLASDDGWRMMLLSVQHDGHHVLSAQQGWGAFNPTRNLAATRWAFDRMNEQWFASLFDWLANLTSSLVDDDFLEVEVVILPADPAHRGLMVGGHGLSVFGGASGLIVAQVWPSAGNLTRLKMGLARAIKQQIERSKLGSKYSISLGDLIAIEGAALTFAARATGREWPHLFNPPEGWDDALKHVAGYYEVDDFYDIVTNVYGNRVPMQGAKPPYAKQLNDDELAYSIEVIRDAWAETDPTRMAAYLYGDELLAAQGHAGEGMAPYAGFAAAVSLAQDVPQFEKVARLTEEKNDSHN